VLLLLLLLLLLMMYMSYIVVVFVDDVYVILRVNTWLILYIMLRVVHIFGVYSTYTETLEAFGYSVVYLNV